MLSTHRDAEMDEAGRAFVRLSLAVPGAPSEMRAYACPQMMVRQPWVSELLRASRAQDKPALFPHYLPERPSKALLDGLEFLQGEVDAMRLVQRRRDEEST